MGTNSIALLTALLFFLDFERKTTAQSTTSSQPAGSFKIVNTCGFPVWVGTQSNAGQASLSMGSTMALGTGQEMVIATPPGWGGRFWGRTGCTFDSNNQGACLTGDCGGNLQCTGMGGKPPATLAEFTLSGADGKDFYDVSLVDGYNLPMAVSPTNTSPSSSDKQSCAVAGCTGDLNESCPSQLQIAGQNGQVIGCQSACAAFQSSQYCCTGSYGTPGTCPPTTYSKTFKDACPKAYSYAYDDASSINTCTGGAYTITFCPSGNLMEGALADASQVPQPQGVDDPVAQDGAASTSSTSSTKSSFRYVNTSEAKSANVSMLALLPLLLPVIWQRFDI